MAHKKDCQCIVCQRIRTAKAKVAQVVPVSEVVDPRPMLADLPIGTNFRYGASVYKKANDPGTVLDLTKDYLPGVLPGNTRVEIITAGINARRAVEPEA